MAFYVIIINYANIYYIAIFIHIFKTTVYYISGFPNLSEWCDRMKDKFWPDWDDCITHGGTRVATK